VIIISEHNVRLNVVNHFSEKIANPLHAIKRQTFLLTAVVYIFAIDKFSSLSLVDYIKKIGSRPKTKYRSKMSLVLGYM